MRIPAHRDVLRRRTALWALLVGATLSLAACGGGSFDNEAEIQVDASGVDTAADAGAPALDDIALPADVGMQVATPSFHAAPVLLDEPGDADAVDNTASSRLDPASQAVSADVAALSTRGVTAQSVWQAERERALAAPADVPRIAPLAGTGTVTTYTPAQIRSAYGLPALPSAGVTPTALQAAQQGAGQTIYIVNAMHNPNVAAELAAFNAKFGLPNCTTKAIAPTTRLPLPAATPAEGCTLSVVYSTPSGTMTSAVPTYDAGWATEIALDVQWAHATAPRARIVLIEAADASLNALLGAVKLANAMGAGAVSMSFGANEGSWTSLVDAAFTAPGMTYLAATGDSGSAVSWPAVSPNVLAVGGTTLRYSGTGSRAETSWSLTGGGISAFTATPAYQTNRVPGMGTPLRRAVADVAFNADPYTGQYTAVMAPGAATVSWISAGGTSLSTPQWAGLVAVANALRAQAGKPVIGAAHGTLYNQIAAVPGTYAATFADIVTGANGSCASCASKLGYDTPTGLGTPNATALLASLAGASAPAPAPVAAPVVTSATVNGKAGVGLSYTVALSSGSATAFSLANAPAGMAVMPGGVITWANPVAGTYAVTVTASNAANGTSGKGVVTFVIAKASPPVITATALSGVAGRPLSGSFGISSPDGRAMSVTVSGIPAGMALWAQGQTIALLWAYPVKGSYALTITARDSAGLTTTAAMPIKIAAR